MSLCAVAHSFCQAFILWVQCNEMRAGKKRDSRVKGVRAKGHGRFRPIYPSPVILLQIVMLSPGTHLEKNHESHSTPNVSQFKKQ